MSRSVRKLRVSLAYTSALEKWVPRLEEQLYRRLERLEVKVARYEPQQGPSQSRPTRAAMRKPQRRVDPELGIGRPSVVVLGARLRSDQRYCRTLIERVAVVVRAGIADLFQSSHA